METITLRRTAEGWMATFTDPVVLQAFGTDTIPTAFTAAASFERVSAEIAALNPGCTVLPHATADMA